MFGLIGSMKMRPGKRDDMTALLLQAADMLRAMDGCYVYLIAIL